MTPAAAGRGGGRARPGFIPVEHAGNTNASAEEADRVAALDPRAAQRRRGPGRPGGRSEAADAPGTSSSWPPNNAHVAGLRSTLPAGHPGWARSTSTRCRSRRRGGTRWRPPRTRATTTARLVAGGRGRRPDPPPRTAAPDPSRDRRQSAGSRREPGPSVPRPALVSPARPARQPAVGRSARPRLVRWGAAVAGHPRLRPLQRLADDTAGGRIPGHPSGREHSSPKAVSSKLGDSVTWVAGREAVTMTPLPRGGTRCESGVSVFTI